MCCCARRRPHYEEAEGEQTTGDWARLVRGARRVGLKRKLWANLGNLLYEIKQRGRRKD